MNLKTLTLYGLTMMITLTGFSQVINLNGNWRFQIGDQQKWSAPTFDDSGWEMIHAPAAWEEEGFNGYDGFAWYRKKFDGQRLSPADSYYLNLGFIDDCDEVYVNGTLIGVSGSMPPKFKTAYNSERKYALPADLINFKGDNTIAIRVFDTTLGGGIMKGKLGVYRQPPNRLLLDLSGLWQFARTGKNDLNSDIREWNKVMVPSPWEHQGFPKYDGYGLYKRVFSLPGTINPNDNLVLVLGKIDDFDKTYLNGRLIGKTNDGRPYGLSESYQQLRVYAIPAGFLKKEGNVLEVVVDDMGNIGGIYEGPVGITTRENYERYIKQGQDSFFRFEE